MYIPGMSYDILNIASQNILSSALTMIPFRFLMASNLTSGVLSEHTTVHLIPFSCVKVVKAIAKFPVLVV